MEEQKIDEKQLLKVQIKELSVENINRAKDLYNRLVPADQDTKGINYTIMNAQNANECMRVINESLANLTKLYVESAKVESLSTEEKTGLGKEIYKILDQIRDPLMIRKKDKIEELSSKKVQELLG